MQVDFPSTKSCVLSKHPFYPLEDAAESLMLYQRVPGWLRIPVYCRQVCGKEQNMWVGLVAWFLPYCKRLWLSMKLAPCRAGLVGTWEVQPIAWLFILSPQEDQPSWDFHDPFHILTSQASRQAGRASPSSTDQGGTLTLERRKTFQKGTAAQQSG